MLAGQLQAARAYIFQTVEAPFWLSKMAELGFPPEDEKTAEELLQIGMRVASLPDNDPVLKLGAEVLKQRIAQVSTPMSNFLKTAQEALMLRDELQQQLRSASQPPVGDPLTKAAEVSQIDHNLRDAALLLRAVSELAALQAAQ